MSRFYFHIRLRDQIVVDHEGSDLPDPAAAREEALASARQILADVIRSGSEDFPEAFVITDCEGRELDTVPFAAVLPKGLQPGWRHRGDARIHSPAEPARKMIGIAPAP